MRWQRRVGDGHSAAAMVIVLVVLSGCADAPRPPGSSEPRITEADGVRTVVNHAPAWSDGEEWTVSAEPSLRIGMLEGPDPYLFDRIKGVARLSDGTIVVLNAGDGQLRYFAPDGSWLHSAGRVGDGPGEMRDGRWLDRLPGDLLQVTHTGGRLRYGAGGDLVADDRLDWNRIHAVGRAASPEGSAGFLMESCDIPAPLFLGDSVLLCGSTNSDVRFLPEEPGVHQGISMVVRSGWELETVDTLGVFTTRSLVMYRSSGRFLPHPLGPAYGPRGWMRVTGSPSRVTFATSDSYRLEVAGMEPGAERLVIERSGGLRAPTAVELATLEPSEPPGLRPPLPTTARATLHAADSVSVVSGAPWVDDLGAIWAPVATGERDPDPGRRQDLDVFDPDGIYLGRVTIPRFRILQIQEDVIVGIERGEFNEEYVVLHDLGRRGAG